MMGPAEVEEELQLPRAQFERVCREKQRPKLEQEAEGSGLASQSLFPNM